MPAIIPVERVWALGRSQQHRIDYWEKMISRDMDILTSRKRVCEKRTSYFWLMSLWVSFFFFSFPCPGTLLRCALHSTCPSSQKYLIPYGQLLKASHQCGGAGVLSNCPIAQSVYDIAHTYTASHPCGCACEF